MTDAENLAKMLTHLAPEAFRAFVATEFAIDLPEPEKRQPKREARAAMQRVLAALAIPARQAIEDVAEKIVLLTDGPGQDVIDGFKSDIGDSDQRYEFENLPDQYTRSIWLYRHAPVVFRDALEARQADVFRQNKLCYTGYKGPKDLSLASDTESRLAFHSDIARHYGCPTTDVAVLIFKRLRPDTETGDDVQLYQVSVHYNRPPEVVDRVEDSELVPQPIVRAMCSHITYEPSTGYIEVLSRDVEGRETLARLTADRLLRSPIDGERIPLKQYDYQSLAIPRDFDLGGENVSAVKVTELGYCVDNRTLLVKVWANDPEDIHAASQILINPHFEFRHHLITYAKLSIRLRKQGRERSRTVSVILRDENKCNVKTKREKDRVLCDRLLEKWGLIRDIGEVAHADVDLL